MPSTEEFVRFDELLEVTRYFRDGSSWSVLAEARAATCSEQQVEAVPLPLRKKFFGQDAPIVRVDLPV
jgi:hypothetical protein